MCAHHLIRIPLACAAVLGLAAAAGAMQDPPPGADDKEELSKWLANPISDLMRLPMTLNYADGIGASDDNSVSVDFEPVIPFSLGERWNLVTRTSISYYLDQPVSTPLGDGDSGFGDVLTSLYFTRSNPRLGGIVWGAGPVFQLPTATEDNLGADQWGAGLAGTVLWQRGQWTFGALGHQVWGVAHLGSENHPDLSVGYLEPFASYVTRSAWTFTAKSEAAYDWERSDTVMPLTVLAGKFLSTETPLQLSLGVTWYVAEADGGPEGLGFSLVVTPVFPQ